MRPTHENHALVVLDTLPECKVVLDALEDPDFLAVHQQPELELKDKTAVRFRTETRQKVHPIVADAYAESTWNARPEFRIRLNDIDFVVDAATRTLQTKGIDRALSTLTGRTAAAKHIVHILSELVIHSDC